jgi:hypothetical protein
LSDGLVDRIRLGWIVLGEAGEPTAEGVTTHQLEGPGGQAFLLGLDGTGVPCMLMATDDAGPEEDVGVVTVRNRELATRAGTRRFVVVACREPSLRDVFDHFLAAVIVARAEAGDRHAGATAVDVLARWVALLRASRPALGPSHLASLLAELLTLEQIVSRDPSRSLAVWTGPRRTRHDLRRGLHAIEVKSTLSHTSRTARINGVDQLEPPDGGSLVLAWHRFEVVPGGELSVFGVAERLIAGGAPAVELYGLMEAAGSPPALREAHEAVRFELRGRTFFAVEGDFPRLVPDTFTNGVPDGVDDVTYTVALPPDEASLDDAAVGALLDRMAGVA